MSLSAGTEHSNPRHSPQNKHQGNPESLRAIFSLGGPHCVLVPGDYAQEGTKQAAKKAGSHSSMAEKAKQIKQSKTKAKAKQPW